MANVNNFMALSDNSLKVLEKRYLKKDVNGKVIETPRDMFLRVAYGIAKADSLYPIAIDMDKTEKDFFDCMACLEFLPNSPTLMNAGRDLGQLAACFVLPIEDSMESIFETVKDAAIIHKSGGGTGFSFSRLRPKNSSVKSTGGIASGPVSFLKVFDAATQAVKQGGTRRGANMGILRVDHPDILEFVKCKGKDKEISNFNISIALTEDFIKKAENNEEYSTIDPHTGKETERLKAREVFNLITEMAYNNGEPGIVFLDRINNYNPTPALGDIEATNPCGEQPLLPYEACNLGSINLSVMVKDGEFDWERLKKVTHVAAHFLDNVIDVNKYPLELIGKRTRETRKIGLGVMGFADMLVKLSIPYNSDKAVKLASEIMCFISKEATAMSVKLAEDRGVAPCFEKSLYNQEGSPRVRNITRTTIAPTGTLSIIANCSSGIEPLFALAYYRNVLDNTRLAEFNPDFEKIAKERGFYSEELLKKVLEEGSVQHIEEVPEDVKKVFVTAHDIAPEWHIKIQAAFQKYTDNAVSKTINFGESATIEDVREAYMLAYKLGLKGLTIYRNNSRKDQVLNINSSAKNADEENKDTDKKHITPRPRPNTVWGTTTKVNTGCGNLYVTINEDRERNPFEVFMQMGKAGGCAMSQLEAIGRLVSLALRSGVDVKNIEDQLRGIRCPSPAWGKDGRILSCSDGIARVMEQRLTAVSMKDKVKTPRKMTDSMKNIVGVCPDCGEALHHVEGCMVCSGCGYSKC